MWVNDFEMSVSCAVHLGDMSGVYSNIAHISSSFSSVRTQRFLAGLLSECVPADMTFLISLWMPHILGTVPGKFMMKFSATLSNGTTFHVQFANISSSFSSVRTQRFEAGLLSEHVTVDMAFLISLWMPLILGTVPRKFMMKFSATLSSGTTFYLQFVQNNTLLTVQQTISTHTTTTT
jgi:hypothetical protein